MGWPPGSEIIMSSIQIPHMVQIARHHNLKVVPLETPKGTFAPRMEDLKNAITPNTKAICIVYIFGTGYDPTPIARFAHDNNLLFIEDSAQHFLSLIHI